ncbi:MAG TPA: metallophosphoesterase [Actinomycetes bacterium]|nr:metallophosphoesterase [Actinomycetes bacterium]
MSGDVADGVVRGRLPDDTLVVLLSDVHLGGAAGSDIFESAAELTGLLEDLQHHRGPLELVLAGDFLDLLRIRDGDEDAVAATLARPDYQRLFAALRALAGAPGRRVVYLVGNHDAEVWWNPQVRQALVGAGLVDVVGLSYAASFASLPDRLVYCEHGNQFDPANAIVDYANPLDSPVGAHVLTEMIRPIASGATTTRGIDLREVGHVFPLAAHPGPAEWIAGRIFYQFLGQLLRWLLVFLACLVGAYLAYAGLTVALGRAAGGPRVLRSVLLEATYSLTVLVFALVVVFLISRRTARDAVTTLAARFSWLAPETERDREALAIRRLLADGRPPPMAGDGSHLDIAVFVSGHTHAPGLSALDRADGRTTVIANTGCWLRQPQPVPAWLGAPPVFVPAFVHSHVRVRSGPEGLTVELWDQPRPAEPRLPWIERAAVAGRMPPQPPATSGPRLVARQVVSSRAVPRERGPR